MCHMEGCSGVSLLDEARIHAVAHTAAGKLYNQISAYGPGPYCTFVVRANSQRRIRAWPMVRMTNNLAAAAELVLVLGLGIVLLVLAIEQVQ